MDNYFKYNINEIFYSIQGEGFNTGLASVFIRFSGCNLNCDFCDTDHSDYVIMELDKIISEIKKYPAKNVVLTGGEPTIQPNISELVSELKKENYNIAIETNGTGEIPKKIDWITVSPKTKEFVLKGDELKLVYTGQCEKELKKYELLDFKHFYLQPKSLENIELIVKIIKKNPIWRLSVQIHKLIGIK